MIGLNSTILDGVTSVGTRDEGEMFFRSDLGVPRLYGDSSVLRFGRIDNLSATTDPSVNDDSGDGYAVGSLWINTTAARTWVAHDVSSGAAVWKLITRTVYENTLATEQSIILTTFSSMLTITVGIAGTYQLNCDITVRGNGSSVGIVGFTNSTLTLLTSNADARTLNSDNSWDYTISMSAREVLTASQLIRVAARVAAVGDQVWLKDFEFTAVLISN